MRANIDLSTTVYPGVQKFVGYDKDGKGCHRRSVRTLTNYGLSSYGSPTNVFKLLYEKNYGTAEKPNYKLVYFGANPKENYKKAIECIDRHLDNNRPIIVGIHHVFGAKYNTDHTTDHFVVIYGREYVDGYATYLYYENGRSQVADGANKNNRFIYDPDGPSLYDETPNIYKDRRFDVTQVRPNDGNIEGTVNQNAVDTNKEKVEEYKPGGTKALSNKIYNSSLINGSTQYASGNANIGEAIAKNVDIDGSPATEVTPTVSVSVTTSSSFNLSVIFGKVFPDDDNNRYIEMPSEEIAIIQYTEPTLTVGELNISNKNYASTGIDPDKISYYVPVVYINDFMIPQTNITNFCLDYSSFAPQVMVEFVDISNDMLSTNIPKPGSYIKVYIGGYGDEKYYKPIRQDFVITNVTKTNKTGGEYQNSGNPIKYRMTGILNVPMGFRKMSWSSSKINARQALFNLSNTVGLGFATNFNTNNNVDVMRWINTQNKSYYDFMKDITQHSCYSPYTFFTSFIDQYYVLNFVECRRLLSHGGKKTDIPQMIYNGIMPEMNKDKNNNVDSEDLNDGNQKVSYYFLSNSEEFKGWSNYIEEYYELNDGYSLLSDGYNKTLTYSDKCGFLDLMSKTYKFRITPIDNMKRDNKKNILPLPDEVKYDTYIPLNLRQTTNSAYANSQKLCDDPTAAESSVDLGEVDTSNNFPLYFYAAVQNDFQMKNLKKCGLSVRLQNYNPSITRFSRIWVDIYDMNDKSSEQIRKKPFIENMNDSKLRDYLEEINNNIIAFKDDTQNDFENQVFNRSLSGWYVVTDMKISYNSVKDFKGVTYKKLQTQLILNRIEYKPSFYNEYMIAKQAIEKYMGDNTPVNIMGAGDLI